MIKSQRVHETPGGKLYTAKLFVFLMIYSLYHKENSGKFESQFQYILKFSQTVGSTFNVRTDKRDKR